MKLHILSAAKMWCLLCSVGNYRWHNLQLNACWVRCEQGTSKCTEGVGSQCCIEFVIIISRNLLHYDVQLITVDHCFDWVIVCFNLTLYIDCPNCLKNWHASVLTGSLLHIIFVCWPASRKVKLKVKRYSSPCTHLRAMGCPSPVIWDHTVLPATRHRWMCPA